MSTSHLPHVSDAKSPRSAGPARRTFRRLYLGLLYLFVLQILIQVFFAGAGIFTGGQWFMFHAINGSLAIFTALLLLIFCLFSGLPALLNWLTVLLPVMVFLQPVWIYPLRHTSVAILSALHPIAALILFALPLFLIMRTHQVISSSHTN
ncbi:hypothetical protein EPA93_47820 [Ktedonosporobacter rubrisoli]|uniref:Uncharacterized protein n=1 Tax=Ktedonosporobacter rubrisoli TaxID=2509675 RepID=A0A4P6K4L2_KTERU|nr:DUF6220 domain-containing protein [Ktedonosporobacter rubrisoli]QBD83267.1 hypothetical protein EPA93_47820 [Ktedonosporobacter rubrisoli]